MPTDKGLMLWGDMDNRRIVLADYEGNPIRIETMTGLTLDQVESDPAWKNFRENMQFTITADLDPGWRKGKGTAEVEGLEDRTWKSRKC